MLKVYNCIVYEHDLRLVALALVVCALASFTAMKLLKHVHAMRGPMRGVWFAVAAAASGSGIWATHFIAMLAFLPGAATHYSVGLTGISLIAAIALTGLGFTVALASRFPDARLLGGAIVGGGIAAMHYTGMAALDMSGHIEWDVTLVGVSILAGSAFGAAALAVGLGGRSARTTLFGALLLTLAIVSHHFIGMGAATVVPDGSFVASSSISSQWLAIGVATATASILFLAFLALNLDVRERGRRLVEADRMRGLANAAVEGLIVCDGDRIVTANDSLARLYGGSAAALVGMSLRDFLPDAADLDCEDVADSAPSEAILRRVDGLAIPIEVICRPVDFAGKRHLAVAVRDLRDRKRAEKRIHFLAHHDPLTDLPNRTSFNARLDEEIQRHRVTGRKLAVLCLDLDRFKEVNDIFGHAAGDELLQAVARCTTGVLGSHQMMARLGGDEFAIIAPDLNDAAQAGTLAEAILEAMRNSNRNAASSALMSTSIGIAAFPTDADDRPSLLNHADTALYRAKADGRGIYRFFEFAMTEHVLERRLLEHDLRHATSRGQLSLVYQPQTDVESGEITGFEALLRWNHPERGPVAPSVFIPIAEETGLILQIGEWTLRAACIEAAAWECPLSIAVNVSAMQLHSADFARIVHAILFETGLSAPRLELEITETALIRDLQRALTTLRQLKALGIRIAMDDFGTGYSSLANLRAFPFDKLKIDRSFITAVDHNEHSAAIVRAVLGLGRGLGLPVVAEGVETEAELSFLARESCSQAQGYLLGKPAPIESFTTVTHPSPSALLRRTSSAA